MKQRQRPNVVVQVQSQPPAEEKVEVSTEDEKLHFTSVKDLEQALQAAPSLQLQCLPNIGQHLSVVADRDLFQTMVPRLAYINLDKCVARRQQVERELERILTLSKHEPLVYRFPAVSCKNGALGCLMSHVLVLQQALTMNQKQNILVFEDDMQFVQYDRQSINAKLQEAVDNFGASGWDVIVFSQFCHKWETIPGVDQLMRLKNCSSTAGYLVEASYIPKLLREWKQHLLQVWHKDTFDPADHLDQVQVRLQQTDDVWLGFRQTICKQRPAYSDIEGTFADHEWLPATDGKRWFDGKNRENALETVQ